MNPDRKRYSLNCGASKWIFLSIAFAVLGIVAAALFYFLQPPVFKSEAKLLVRYVFDTKGTEGVGTDSQIKTPDSHGDNIINSEIEILTSMDLCEQVASAVGPDKILRKPGSTNELQGAAAVIRKGLTVEVPNNSSVLRVSLQHRDPEVATRALGQLVDAYLRRHIEVHRAIGASDTVLSQQADMFRTRLADTERRLRELKSNFVGVSIEDAKKALSDQLARIRQDIFASQAQLAETAATVGVSPAAGPGLTKEPPIRAPGAVPVLTLDSEKLHFAGLQARIAALTNQLAQVRTELAALDSIEGDVQRMQRVKELEEKNYRYYAAGIEQARFDEALAGGRLANISIIQAPTPPVRKKRSWITVGLLASGLLGGLIIAFLNRGAPKTNSPSVQNAIPYPGVADPRPKEFCDPPKNSASGPG